ncbi:NAD-dependent DNA ligase LigA [Blautia hansenii]|uniref:NAD-dependent DNA ligase LigA n=1 Tax=Blautia hansenii TaxID=1322 RepID=UPI0022E7F109|nr:NAD-dependent DNA ligase LigA [Blautia hansenii]
MNEMRAIIEQLKAANVAYYQESREIMSNYDYDKLYDKLVDMEKETGVIYSDSPTQSVANDFLDFLPKEKHEKKMLSLDKTKSVETLKSWISDKDGILSWKLDGLTVVLTYDNGELQKAVTRGNGTTGEIITQNVSRCKGVPFKIPYKEKLILRGEAVISYTDFDRINSQIEDVGARYKNPRNLASGSIRLLDASESQKRNVQVIIFRLISGSKFKTMDKQFNWLSEIGFNVVEHYPVNKDNIEECVKFFKRKIENNDIPTDGLVVSYNNTDYGNSLGNTSKFERHSFAFKWKDEVAETTLKKIEWSPSRTGLLNPVAIFEPVELEGTTVSRASVHNISIIKELKFGIGDTIKVIKSNMIIPQIVENSTKSNNLDIPKQCPICGGDTNIICSNDTEVLMCMNTHCPEKLIGKFVHFCERDAMNIEGMSEATVDFLVKKGWLKTFKDFYNLSQYKATWMSIPGFGKKSVEKLFLSIEKSKQVSPERLLYALGIPKIGRSQSREIFNHFDTWDDLIKSMKEKFDFSKLDGFGDVLNKSIYDWFKEDYKSEEIEQLVKILVFEEKIKTEELLSLTNKTFVITGSLNKFSNRNDLKSTIETHGGKVTGSVTSKTHYLINNDTTSNSSKNKKAKELGIPIISEEDFLTLL